MIKRSQMCHIRKMIDFLYLVVSKFMSKKDEILHSYWLHHQFPVGLWRLGSTRCQNCHSFPLFLSPLIGALCEIESFHWFTLIS